MTPLILAAFLVPLSASQPVREHGAAAPPEELAVYVAPFRSKNVANQDFLDSFTDLVETELSATRTVTIVDRREVNRLVAAIWNEDELARLGQPSMATLSREAKLVLTKRATGVVFGNLLLDDASGDVIISARLERFDGTIVWRRTTPMRRGLVADFASRHAKVRELVLSATRSEENSKTPTAPGPAPASEDGGDESTPSTVTKASPSKPRAGISPAIGFAWFRSADGRRSTESLGAQQAAGFVARFAVLVKGLEASAEAAIPARPGLDSELLALTSVRRYSRDSFFSVLLAKPFTIGNHVALVPTGGGGFAGQETTVHQYAVVGGLVQTTTARTLTVKPAAAAGIDLRAGLSKRVHAVASYRLHVVAGRDESMAGNRTAHQQFGVGLEFSLKDKE